LYQANNRQSKLKELQEQHQPTTTNGSRQRQRFNFSNLLKSIIKSETQSINQLITMKYNNNINNKQHLGKMVMVPLS